MSNERDAQRTPTTASTLLGNAGLPRGLTAALRTGRAAGRVVGPVMGRAAGRLACLLATPAIAQVLPPAAEVAEAGGDVVSFSAFSEPVELTTLIDFVGTALEVNIIVRGSPTGTIVFNAPVEVPRSSLLALLDAMLEQYGFTVSRDEASGFYIVKPISDVRPAFEGELATTRIIPTPNVKPSLLQGAIANMLGEGGGGIPGQPQQGGVGGSKVAYIDELGVIAVTAPPRTVAAIETIVARILDYRATLTLHRIELTNIASSVARQRAIALAGGQQSGGGINAQAEQLARLQAQGLQGQPLGFGGGTLDNLSDRLALDAQSNDLLFRGTPDELRRVRELIEMIDVPNTLEPRSYFAGSAAQQIADIASQRGLGEVIQLQSAQSGQGGANPLANFEAQLRGQFGQQAGTGTMSGGPVMVVDATRGSIVYYGTDAQQAQLQALLEQLGTEDERIVIREYKLDNAAAEDVAELLTAIITGEQLTGDSALLPEGGSVPRQAQVRRDLTPVVQPDGSVVFQGGGDDVSAAFDPDLVIVVPDVANNQVVVRAPVKQQDELAKLIGRLDLRRPQVYIQATIVSISETSTFDLAVEVEANAGQWFGSTNFGLSSTGTGTNFTDPKVVNPGLAGLTTALIKSEYVPFIINAIQTDTDSRILSTPSLLVNDNEESTITSTDQQPTTSTSQGTTTDITSFAGYEDAGTTLTVTPSISGSGFLRLQYEITSSNFIGTGSAGIPPPRQERSLTGNVTLPSDHTVIIGGLKVDDLRDTIRKVPLLGDIPVLGELFKSTSKAGSNSTLYVFLTPKIMTDPNFYDLKLLSEGPRAGAELDPDAPDLEPVIIRSLPARSGPAAGGSAGG